MRVLKLHCFFYKEIQNFKIVPKLPFVFLQRNTEFWELYPNGHSYFPQGNTKCNYCIINLLFFLKIVKKLKIWFRDTLFRFFTMKNEIRSIEL